MSGKRKAHAVRLCSHVVKATIREAVCRAAEVRRVERRANRMQT